MQKEDIYRLCGVIVLAIFFAWWFSHLRHEEEKTWNNGFCSCGGRWEYMQPIGHAYSTDYIYKCDKCGKMHEFSKVRD